MCSVYEFLTQMAAHAIKNLFGGKSETLNLLRNQQSYFFFQFFFTDTIYNFGYYIISIL